MTSLSLSTGLTLEAAPADGPAPRTAEGILVPWDEPGRTNLGRGIAVRRGSIAVPPRVVGIMGHDRSRPVSRLVAHEERAEGLWGRLRIAETPEGDLLLAELRAGIRDGLSVEVDVTEQDLAGNVTAGRLDFVAHLPVGAFDSAGVHALAATVTTPNGDTVTQPAPAAAPAAPAPAAPADLSALVAAAVGQALAPTLAQLQAAAYAAPAGGAPSAASLLPGAPQVPATAPASGTVLTGDVDPLEEASRLAAQYHQTKDATLLAALQDVTASGLPLFQEHSSRLGEKLWEGTKDTTRPFVDLMAQADLTAMKYYGWEWTDLPEMQEWAGNKNAITGNPVNLRQVPFEARRCAAGWDVDRKYKDFGDAEFWREFFTEQTNAYRRLTNQWAAEAIVGAAVDVTDADSFSDAATPGPLPADAAGLVPAGGLPESTTRLLRAVMIGNVLLENTPRVEQTADYVLVNAFDFLELGDLAGIDFPALLALLKVDVSGFRQTTKVPRGSVIVGARQSMKYRELSGTGGKGTPIRVEALDVVRGGVDSAVYGYVGISRERVGGVLSIPLAAATP